MLFSEITDNIDNDCDGYADDADVGGATGKTTFYRDADSDGYGSSVTARTCSRPTGYVGTGGDCDDTTSAVSSIDI